ncbi:MAG: DNRLRE domain-containing protein [Anaerolineales bacterium]|nr:DNRLRE domain-containing protein [Anaerolineales bacterium]
MCQKQIKSLLPFFVLFGTFILMNVSRTMAANGVPQTIVTFQDGVDSYTGTRDTYLWDVNPNDVHGSETTMVQDKNANDDRLSLLSFDLSSIPAGATITSAELQFYVDQEGQGFNMYRMLKPWDEATISFTSNGGHFAANDNDAESTINSNWPGVDGYVGYITVSVPAATIQDWYDGTLTNNGWLMIATHDSDGQQLRTREHATIANRPKLTIEYNLTPTDPTITIIGTPLSVFNSEPGTPSAEQNYMVAGINLTENIEIIAPTNFQISTSSGSGFGPSLTLPHSGGTVAATTIYVRFERATDGTTNGDISHTSSGAVTQNVAVSGTAAFTGSFQDGVNSYAGTRDTYLYDVSPDDIHGSETTMVQDINPEDDRTSLLSFDLSSIPAGSAISSAELQFYVDTEGQGFNMHRMLKPWDEATISFTSNGGHFAADDTDAESAVDANWPGVDTYVGTITVTVPATTIQNWIDGTLTNNGWLMLATHESDGQQLRTREHATIADHPKLSVVYVAAVAPTLSISTSQLTRTNETPNCIYNLDQSSMPYSGFTESQADIGPSPIDISSDIGGVPDYYYVEDNCGAGGTAVSNTVAEFSFDIVPGT